MNKKQWGQFFTTNADVILKGLERFVKNKDVADPFAGSGDLLAWAKKNGAKKMKGYDVDPTQLKNRLVTLNDNILKPKKYDFVITNPPYLNVNKASKETKEKYLSKYLYEDLYQASLASIMDSKEGIAIVPINFLSAENSVKIRKVFFDKFRIVKMNYFTKRVFSDTTYNVIAFYYKKSLRPIDSFNIEITIFPANKKMTIPLHRKYDWTIGGEAIMGIKHQDNFLGIHRLTGEHLTENPGPVKISTAYNHIDTRMGAKVSEKLFNTIKSNIIFLRAIDSGSEEGKIKLEDIRDYSLDCLVSKESSRHMIHLIFSRPVSIKDQEKIIKIFNDTINDFREKHSSLFLTNFRDNGRKRISFDFVYKMINYIYQKDINPDYSPQPAFKLQDRLVAV